MSNDSIDSMGFAPWFLDQAKLIEELKARSGEGSFGLQAEMKLIHGREQQMQLGWNSFCPCVTGLIDGLVGLAPTGRSWIGSEGICEHDSFEAFDCNRLHL